MKGRNKNTNHVIIKKCHNKSNMKTRIISTHIINNRDNTRAITKMKESKTTDMIITTNKSLLQKVEAIVVVRTTKVTLRTMRNVSIYINSLIPFLCRL